MIKALIGAPYNLKSALNGGCKLTINSQLPRGEALHVRSRLLEIDDNERRVLLRKEIITGTASNPEALCAETTFIVPRRTKEKSKREKLKIHAEAKRIASWSLPSNAGREFAILTGDINPIHSLPVFAKIAGFKSCILHGFSSFARATETLIEEQASGNPKALAMIEASFTRAIVIPGEIGVYTTETGDFFIGHENGGESFVNGTFSLHPGT
jgi:acyl dehydratase